jgi:hypothetical protein
MKKAIPVILFGLLSVIPLAAQVEISPKKVIYVRQGKDVPDFKKRFEVRYPMVEGARNATVKRRIEAAIDYWKLFDNSLEGEINDGYWLYSMDYEVAYNKDGILDINLITEGSGAYPDGSSRHVVLNTKTGRTATIADTFFNLPGLMVMIDRAQKQEVADKIKELERDDPDEVDYFRQMMDDGEYRIGKLDEFSISDDGVTFIFDYGFPHVIQALEPDGEYFFSWEELNPYIRARGLLAKFNYQ